MSCDALVFIKTHIFLLVTQPAHKTIYLYYSLSLSKKNVGKEGEEKPNITFSKLH